MRIDEGVHFMQTDIGDIQDILNRLPELFRTKDAAGLAALIARDADAVFLGTDASELLVGKDAYVDALGKQLGSADLQMIPRESWVKRRDDVAWYTTIVDFVVTTNGQTMRLPGVRSSGVFERRDGVWMMVQGHMSVGQQAG